MSVIDFEVGDYSEKYKEYIRGLDYGDTIIKTTNEYVKFIYNKKEYTIKFKLEFSFDFDCGFHYSNFFDFTISKRLRHEVWLEFEKYIKEYFVNSDRLSC